MSLSGGNMLRLFKVIERVRMNSISEVQGIGIVIRIAIEIRIEVRVGVGMVDRIKIEIGIGTR